MVLIVMVLIVVAGSTASLAQDSFVIPVERLKSLNPEKPSDYRDLAEELSEVTGSKIAKDLTVRLNLICAAHSSGRIRRSALLGLIRSARNKQELQKFKALAYLHDAQFSSLLHQPNTSQQDGKSARPEGQTGDRASTDKILDALRSLRQGKARRAKKIMEAAAVRKEFARYGALLPLDEFLPACESGIVDDGLLLKILDLEAKIRGGSFKPDIADKSIGAWRVIFKNRLPPRIPRIELDSVTEFDPAKSVFRNGLWRLPTEK